MKIYVRKIDEQCITHQISFRKVVWQEFLDEAMEFVAQGVTSGYSETVKVLPATDYRFDAGLNHVLSKEGKVEIGDLIAIYKDGKYEVELIKPSDPKYVPLKEFCNRDERHTLINVESDILDTNNRREKFKNWLVNQNTYKDITISNYVRSLDYIKIKGFTKYDLYTITNRSIIKELLDSIKTNSDFASYNNSNNRTPSSALQKYDEFLRTIEFEGQKDEIDLKDFYFEILQNNKHVEDEIRNRKQFLNEYPLERLLKLSKEEYCLGLDNKKSFCHKLEFGDYEKTGFGIGGGSAGKHGMYFSKNDGVYKGKNNNIIENPDEYWEKYRRQLYDFLKEMGKSEPNFVLDEKYPLLGGSGNYMVLTKLLCLYYPDRFIAMSNSETYKKFAKYLNVKLGNNAIYNSYYANIYFRDYLPESNKNDGFYIANAIWKYFNSTDQSESEDASKYQFGGFNKIYYGVPGSGKSYTVNNIFNEDKGFHVIRTTFHPEYTNADFVGQIIPKLHKQIDGTNTVSYDFKEGSFTKALKYALDHKDEKVVLIIEEINRGNASAIFGDIFQLLDREETGESKYSINNEVILDYLNEGGEYENVVLPPNLWIIGTMNTSDQNVFTLDTAFKRRWKMEYIPNVFVEDDEYSKLLRKIKIPRTEITWEDFVTRINEKIANSDNSFNSEDKQLGMYFVTLEEVGNEKEFAEKILSYLWEDVAKIDLDNWFGEVNTYDELLAQYEKSSIKVFNNLFDNYQIHLESNENEVSNGSDSI